MAKTIKIQVLQSIAGKDFSYGKGGKYDVPATRAKEFLDAGLAVPVDNKRTTKSGNETAALAGSENTSKGRKKKNKK